MADEKLLPQGLPVRLHFTTEMSEAAGCNVLHTAGALHYWEHPMREFFRQLGTKPRHFIVNRSPMRDQGETFYTVQEGRDWAVPCLVRSLAGLVDEMRAEGYALVDSWVDKEKKLVFPWLPAFSCDYRGAYFRKEE